MAIHKAKKTPQMAALDQMIQSFGAKLENLKNQQAELQTAEEDKSNQISLANSFAQTPTVIYEEIENTLKLGLDILKEARSYIESTPDSEAFSSIASLMNSIQGFYSEFTDIWKKQINFQNAVNMENLKFDNKKKLEEHKMQLKLKYFNETNTINAEVQQETVPFNTLDLIESLEEYNKQ